jgi:hypothetical protein
MEAAEQEVAREAVEAITIREEAVEGATREEEVEDPAAEVMGAAVAGVVDPA